MRSIQKILYLNQTAEAVLRFNKEGMDASVDAYSISLFQNQTQSCSFLDKSQLKLTCDEIISRRSMAVNKNLLIKYDKNYQK